MKKTQSKPKAEISKRKSNPNQYKNFKKAILPIHKRLKEKRNFYKTQKSKKINHSKIRRRKQSKLNVAIQGKQVVSKGTLYLSKLYACLKVKVEFKGDARRL